MAQRLPTDQFLVYLTLPKTRRAALRQAAGGLELPMSEFSRRAVEEAIRRVEAGQRPFPTETISKKNGKSA